MAHSLHSITAIIVTYNSGASYRENFLAIISQVKHAIIVDNGSDKDTLQLLDDLQKEYPDTLTLIKNSENIGLAKAQNIGINQAIKQGCDAILLMDDDSKADPNMIAHMKKHYEAYSDQDAVAMIAPYLDEHNIERNTPYLTAKWKLFFKRRRFQEEKVMDDVISVIASGCLIKTDAIKRLGLFCEDFFIDYIDSEFSARVISHGYKILVVKEAVLQHHLGDKTQKRFGPVNVIPTHHSALRRFTIYRNRVWVWKRYLFKVPAYVFFDMFASLLDLWRILCFEKNRWAKLKMAMKGFFVGLFTWPQKPAKP